MKRSFTIIREYLVAAFLVALGLSAYGCGDSGSISEGPPVRLSSLTVTPPKALQPAFSPDTTDYRATVSTSDTTVVVTAAPENSGTTMTIDGRQAGAGQAISVPLGQAPSTKSIFIRVTDQSGGQSTYVVLVTRPASSNNDLRNLAVSPGTLNPSFGTGTTRYEIQVGSGTTKVTVTPTLQDPTATLEVDGQSATSGQARAIDLSPPGSSKDITILVTAPSGRLKSYIVTVVRAALGGNFNLESLAVSSGSLNPSFNAGITRYSVNVGSGTDRMRVTATPQDPSATLQVNGEATNSGQAREIGLQAPGLRTDIDVLVIAPNGSRQPYVITVNRAALSSDNNLETLSVTPGTLEPEFAAGTEDYEVDVASTVESITVTATKSDPNAVISGSVPNQGQATIQLDGPGTSKTISVTVTAPNGNSKTYRVTVNREKPSSDNNLSLLTVSAGTLVPAFSSSRKDYRVDVSAADEIMTVQATKSDSDAVMSALGSVIAAAGVPTGRVTSPLGPGTSTKIPITVKAPNGAEKTYTVTVTRPSR